MSEFAFIATAAAALLYYSRGQKRPSSSGILVPPVKDPYYPVETGYKDNFQRRLPQASYNRGFVVGDVSPLNPIPFSSVVPEVKSIQITQWGSTPIDPAKQLDQIMDKLVFDENDRFDSFLNVPKGKKRWRKHIFI